MKSYRKRRLKGFTLIELLVAIALIALLMGVLMPALRKAREVARMIACAGNQKQVILALATYAQDNDSRLPPSSADNGGGGWHRPNDLNWMQQYWSARRPLTDAEMESVKNRYHYVGKYLGDILKDGKVFNCPLSGIRDDDVWPPYGSAAGTYGEFYRSGRYAFLPCTYALLWSFEGYNPPATGSKPFDAPNTLADKNTLVIQDTLMYLESNPEVSWYPNPADAYYSYYSCHPFTDALRAGPYYGLKMAFSDILPGNMNNLKLNAGYLDGHVEKFSATDAIYMTHNNYAHNWIAPKFR
ncbi:MAG: type II secretion system protein [Phycisphaerae bacterium]|nr:type II secretion system protein [Phycisphaerae bacterium]